MAIVLGGSGPQADPDDEKARTTQALCEEWRRRLNDTNFTSQLPAGAKDLLEAAVNKVWFDLAVYRGELLKAQKRRSVSPLGGLATSTTMPQAGGANPVSVITVLIGLAVAAIAVVVVANTPGVFSLGKVLETSVGNLQSTSEQVVKTMTPVALDFSPSLPPKLLNELMAKGVIVGSGVAMAVSIEKLRKYVEGIFGTLGAISAAKQKECASAIATVAGLATSLSQLVEKLAKIMAEGGEGKAATLGQIMDLLKKLGDAMDALNLCLGGTANKPN